MFEHDLPRLSLDIDLTWLSVQDFEADVAAMSAVLEQLAETLRARPLQLQVQSSIARGREKAAKPSPSLKGQAPGGSPST